MPKVFSIIHFSLYFTLFIYFSHKIKFVVSDSEASVANNLLLKILHSQFSKHIASLCICLNDADNQFKYINSKYELVCCNIMADVDMDKPDERSIMTYVAKFLEKFPDPDMDFPDVSKVSLKSRISF
jgi:hypothetical protein